MDLVVSDRFFNPVYIPYAGASQRYQFFYGGSSSGKSAFVATRIVLDAVIGRNTLCLRQHANRIPTSCFAEIVKAIDRMEARHLYTINQNAITSTLSGGQILFSGLDDEEKIKSISPASGPLTDVWVEEATEITYAAFKQLDKRLRGLCPHKKRLTCTFNPSNRSHWLYTKYFAGLGDEHPKAIEQEDLLILRTTHLDNRFLSPEDHQALEKESDSYYYDTYTKGLWGKKSDGVFRHLSVGQAKEGLPAFWGLDFGFTAHPSAAVQCAYDEKENTVYILKEEVYYGHLNQQLAQKLRPLLNGAPIFCDSAEPKSIAELRKEGVYALAANKGKDSVKRQVARLSKMKVVVSPDCPQFYREAEGYTWQKNLAGENTDVPIPGNDHLIDALRYALSGVFEKRVARYYN